MLEVLRRRDFALLWTAGLISIAGDWVLYAALPFYVYEHTGSTIATAGMIAAELTPAALLGIVAGVFVDRWNRKRILVWTNLGQAAVVAVLLLVPNGWLWVVYAVAAIQAGIAAFAAPAEGALLPALVGAQDLLAANALNALNNRLARLLGLPLGGALLGALGLRAVVVVDCATFVLAALLVAPIAAPLVQRVTEELSGTVRSAWGAFTSDLAGGLRLVRSDRRIGILFGVIGLMTFGGTMIDPLTVAWVRDVLHRGPGAYAVLMTAHAVSGIAGALVVGRFRDRLSPSVLTGWGSAIAGIALLVKYNVPVYGVAVALFAFGGIVSVASSVGLDTAVQHAVRDEYRGRVLGALGTSGALLSLSGAVAGGTLAELVGVIPMLDVASVLVLASGFVAMRAFAQTAGSTSAPGRI